MCEAMFGNGICDQSGFCCAAFQQSKNNLFLQNVGMQLFGRAVMPVSLWDADLRLARSSVSRVGTSWTCLALITLWISFSLVHIHSILYMYQGVPLDVCSIAWSSFSEAAASSNKGSLFAGLSCHTTLREATSHSQVPLMVCTVHLVVELCCGSKYGSRVSVRGSMPRNQQSEIQLQCGPTLFCPENPLWLKTPKIEKILRNPAGDSGYNT